VSIFFSLTPEPSLMEKALIAYGRAEQNTGGDKNPDLYFGRAQVHRYLQSYHLSAQDYLKAYELDPSLPSLQALSDMESVIAKSSDLVYKGATRLVSSKKLTQIASGLNQYELPQGVPYDLTSLKQMTNGLNQGKAIALKMICPIGQNDFPPPYVHFFFFFFFSSFQCFIYLFFLAHFLYICSSRLGGLLCPPLISLSH
jgi:hypothetical protein